MVKACVKFWWNWHLLRVFGNGDESENSANCQIPETIAQEKVGCHRDNQRWQKSQCCCVWGQTQANSKCESQVKAVEINHTVRVAKVNYSLW
jgi:hypothetical protein